MHSLIAAVAVFFGIGNPVAPAQVVPFASPPSASGPQTPDSSDCTSAKSLFDSIQAERKIVWLGEGADHTHGMILVQDDGQGEWTLYMEDSTGTVCTITSGDHGVLQLGRIED